MPGLRDHLLRRVPVAALALGLVVACGESTAPRHGFVRVVVVVQNTPDISGTYALQTLQGVTLPARFPGVFAPRDSVYGGCLALGAGNPVPLTRGDTTWTYVYGSANENIFHTQGGADSAAANPQYCPQYTAMSDGGSHYSIAGDSGWVYICGKTTCDSTRLVIARAGPPRTVTLGDTTFGRVYLGR